MTTSIFSAQKTLTTKMTTGGGATSNCDARATSFRDAKMENDFGKTNFEVTEI